MKTVNGKLISEQLNQLQELTEITEQVTQRCNKLESQVTTLSKQDYTQYFQKVYSEINTANSSVQKVKKEVNTIKSSQQELDKRINGLKDIVSTQEKQLRFLKISIMAFVGLWLILNINNQPQKHTQSYQFSAARINSTTQPKTKSISHRKLAKVHKRHITKVHKLHIKKISKKRGN